MVLSDIENNLSEDNENNKGTQKDVFDNVNVQDDFFYKKAKEHIIIYQNDNTNISSIVDIIATYVKGQRILYTESKTLCEQRLSSLMVPSILFTVICSIVNLILKDYIYGNVITSCLNGLIAFILALINYLKLDARAEAHRSSAYKYDKLLSYINFQSGKLFFLEDETKKFGEIIMKVERDIAEIKESNQFVLPEKIRYSFPKLSGINVFTEVKRIERIEIQTTNQLANYMKLIHQYETERKLLTEKNEKTNTNNITEKAEEKEKEKFIESKLTELENNKFLITMELIKIQEEYLSIDKTFEEEMDKYRYKNRYLPKILDYLKV
jgi:hypothetical protein